MQCHKFDKILQDLMVLFEIRIVWIVVQYHLVQVKFAIEEKGPICLGINQSSYFFQ